MDFENMNVWCWIIPLLVGVICGILGYLIGKGSNTAIDNTEEIKMLTDKNAKLKADLDACLASKATVPVASLATEATAAATLIPFDGAAAKAALGKNIKQDDLKIIEGIGPKIESMFQAEGIKTWKALSESSVAACQKVLDGGGKRYQIHDPASWPMQAKMAYEGKWKDLAKWQEEHKHGKL